ncbi:copper chaperone PCu(A)C [Deinococcus depolymerans]|uniref:Copper chaperone PCu(A)C n=1 Tax=Deinococcus depolymerans TaxID=392408 RepID=A0ABN1BH39_9DEIO
MTPPVPPRCPRTPPAVPLALLALLTLNACGPGAASETAAGTPASTQTATPAAPTTHDMGAMAHSDAGHGDLTHGATHGKPVAADAAPQTAAPLPITVSGGRVVAVPPGVRDTSVFATLTNTGPDDIQLSGVSSPAATGGTLMVTRTDAAGLTGMSAVDTLTVPAGGTLTLSDTGDHLMLSGLKAPLQEGERLSLTLTDTQGRALTLDLPVLKP